MNEQIERILALYARANEGAIGEECLQVRRLAAEMLMYEMERETQQPTASFEFMSEDDAYDILRNHRKAFIANAMQNLARIPNAAMDEVDKALLIAAREVVK